MHGAIGLGHLSICSHFFRIGKQLNCWCFTQYIIRIRIFIIPIIESMGTSKLHTLIIVIGGNYTYTMYIKKKYIYIYKYNVSCRVQSLKKKKKKKKKNMIIINNINRKRKNISVS